MLIVTQHANHTHACRDSATADHERSKSGHIMITITICILNIKTYSPLKSNKICFNQWSCSVVSDSEIPWTVTYQAPPSMEFSRQEYWSGLPFPSPGDLPDPGIEPRSPTLQADALPSELPICLGSAILLNFVIVLGWCFIFLWIFKVLKVI